jgi:hypothetical protein
VSSSILSSDRPRVRPLQMPNRRWRCRNPGDFEPGSTWSGDRGDCGPHGRTQLRLDHDVLAVRAPDANAGWGW